MSLFIYEVLIRLFMTFILSLLLTPLVKLLAFRIGAYDAPGERRINTKNMPTAGGLAIYIAFASSCLLIFRSIIPQDYIWPIILAGGMVVLTGLIDDIKEITPMKKNNRYFVSSISYLFCCWNSDRFCDVASCWND
ncbi:hypothetical protein EfsSVR2331_07920 [Enterococcus faecalis]|nr:hypothetical protein EfsSVR2331_07920 [Enterococcus faecalis]